MTIWDPGEHHPPWASPRTAIGFCWSELSKSTRWKLLGVTAASALLAVLDFVAILMMAGMGASVALIVSGSALIDIPLPEFLAQQPQERIVVLLGAGGTVLLATKSLLAWRTSRRVFLFTALRVPEFATRIYRRYMGALYPAARALSVQQVTSAVNVGSQAMAVIITSAVGLVTEAFLLLLLVLLMFVASPLLFAATLAYFGSVAWLVARVIGRRSAANGRIMADRGLMASHTLGESVGFSPEIRLYGLQGDFVARLQRDQWRVAEANALQQSWVQTPRYIFETALILGFAAAAAVSFLTQSPQEAAFSVGLFLVTSARIVPSLLRANGMWAAMHVAVSQLWIMVPVMRLPSDRPAKSAFAAGLSAVNKRQRHDLGADHDKSAPEAIRLIGVSFQYPSSKEWAIRDVTLTVHRGSRVALVGATGAGKSTLAEILLGLIKPTEGMITGWPLWASGNAKVAFVPQDVYTAPDTIRNNVALSLVGEPADDDRIWRSLTQAQVDGVVRALPHGLETKLGERGVRLSGGEIQRLGLARALYREPQLLVLDEATSNLDAGTENKVAGSLSTLSRDITVVTIAHRLATVREADLVVLLDHGRLLGVGRFDELVSRHPELAAAAAMQGLLPSTEADQNQCADSSQE